MRTTIALREPNQSAGWSADDLRAWLASAFRGESIVVLANREPIRHDQAADGSIAVKRSGGGLVTALEPLIQACSGVWVAHGSGTADRLVVDGRDGLGVPSANPSYRLRRVWLDPAEERGYYQGFANEGLWPLCHRAHVQPIFRSRDFDMYRAVNARFAEAVGNEATTASPVVLVQDYHFALAPLMIKRRVPLGSIIAFWHIPWPSPRDFAICPWGRELLKGLLGSTIVGFQTPEDGRNFIDTVEWSLDADIDRTRSVITYDGRRTTIRVYPVSIEWPSRYACQSPPVEACRAAIRREVGLRPDALMGVGVDRLDYTKGICEKFLAVERLLETHPEYRERFVFVQIAEPSRECLPAYRELRSRVQEETDRINARFGADGYRPIVLRETRHEPADVYRFLRAADLCYVGSLHDGMNLVAKEFVSARNDERGVLILSEFAGAAYELTDAMIVNPYATEAVAGALADALRMPRSEQAARMCAMRAVVARQNAYRWAGEMLGDAARLRHNPPKPQDERRTRPLRRPIGDSGTQTLLTTA
jgi:trehalose 6-phosphate synthase